MSRTCLGLVQTMSNYVRTEKTNMLLNTYQIAIKTDEILIIKPKFI